MVGAFGAVDARGAAKLGHNRHHSLTPRRAHVGLDSRERAIKRAKELRQAPLGDAFVVMGVPTVEGERADARPVGLRQKFCRGAGRFGEISAHLSGAGPARLLTHTADLLDRRQLGIVFEHGREFGIGMAIKFEQALRGIGVRRLNALRRP